MKTRIIIANLLIGMIMGLYAQEPVITLTFTADNNGQHIPMNSILIENLTQGGDTTLYSPDTILVLDYITGISENETIRDDMFSISQNYPNPIEDKTTITLYLAKNEDVLITISDIMGRVLIYQEYQLDGGKHFFTFFPARESLYFMTARIDHKTQTIKMSKSPSCSFTSGNCTLEYNGQQTGFEDYKAGNNINNFVFIPGDELSYTANTNLGERTITSYPTGDQTYHFHYTGEPCSDIPTITDIDNNTYNTVQIGNQCWMKENLKTTTFNNGIPIPNVNDDAEWKILASAAYVWYDNDISWKEEYGALYNWYTTADSNGLCPAGWHMPTTDEWTILSDYIGGTNSPHGNELKSCRQVNSPLGGDCNTTIHPRWKEYSTHYGTDDYNFSGLPGGIRNDEAMFISIGARGSWWSSTQQFSHNAWNRQLFYHDGYFAKGPYLKENGFSVRCLRD